MTELSIASTDADRPRARTPGLFKKDDWWAVAIGLGLVVIGYLSLSFGPGLAWLAVLPAKWSHADQLAADLSKNALRYVAQFAVWLVLTTTALSALGYRLRQTVPAFAFLYVVSTLIIVLGQWDQAVRYNLEPPLVALAVGLILANLHVLPRELDAGFRVEFYVKLGVVLLGATLPLTLIVWAGPIAFLQASIVSLVTFGVIFFTGRALGIDPRFAATLGVGGAVCGVSAAIAIAAAVGARKQDAAVVISIVIFWAIVMLFVIPFGAQALHLPAGIGGAWIGTSEFADAAGFAAAQAYGEIAAKVPGAAANASDQAVAAFTLMKVIGRDIWIGIWAIVLSVIATTYWSQDGITNRPQAREIWTRFPKFVIGFLLTSAFVTFVAYQVGHADFSKVTTPALVTPIKNLRIWAFTFGFLSIGLTTRVRDLAGVGFKPVLAFSTGVVVNVVLGLVLSVLVFGAYWEKLSP
ncbi:YeiH family protein [Beijerinckia sp. L45]|uniref:YeiH family protein n=1 Tax=Beijerinckia sp. L45 TaxID=1641855 RepID=UPI00131CB298|nr:putative sulfate exporter family transporter [Beijerinckia sp. L45]